MQQASGMSSTAQLVGAYVTAEAANFELFNQVAGINTQAAQLQDLIVQQQLLIGRLRLAQRLHPTCDHHHQTLPVQLQGMPGSGASRYTLAEGKCYAAYLSHLVALGLVSMMLLCKIAKPVGLVDRTEMRKTDCFGKTRLVLHVPSSS